MRRRVRRLTEPSRNGSNSQPMTTRVFDKEITIDATLIRPQITWGTSPEHVIAIDAQVPDPVQRTRSRAARVA